MKIAFDIRGIEGGHFIRALFLIMFLHFLLYPFGPDAVASSSMTLTLPELSTCKDSGPLRLSNVVETENGFNLKPVVSDCLGSAVGIASYLVPFSLANISVTVPYASSMLGQRTSSAKALGLPVLPVSVEDRKYYFDTDFEDIRLKLSSGDYCLLIWHERSDDKHFCINKYRSVKDDRLASSSIGNQIVYSYETASLADSVVGAFPMFFSPFYISAVDFWYYGAEYFLRPKGLDVSADFLQHSLFAEPKDLEFDEESEVAKKIRESEKYRVAIDEVKNQISEGYLKSDEPILLNFTSGDLFASIKKADLKYNAVLTDKGYTVSITITDDYDYHPLLKEYGSDFFLTIMNNLAFANQYIGVIHDYGIKIEFQEFISF